MTEKPQHESSFLTVKEFSELLRVDHKTVRKEIREGRIPVLRLGRTIRIPRDVLESLPKEVRVVPPQKEKKNGGKT